MLTSTYTLVALSVEQTKMRTALQSLVRELHALPDEAGVLPPGRAAQLCTELRRVIDDCHWRKLDKFLVPALRRHSEVADGILADLELLSRGARDALACAEACVDAGARGVDRDSLIGAVERCVEALRRRLEREEDELFPLARSVVRGETWFAIANQMLAHDAVAREVRGGARPGFGRRERFEHGHVLHDGLGRAPAGPDFGRHYAGLSSVH